MICNWPARHKKSGKYEFGGDLWIQDRQTAETDRQQRQTDSRDRQTAETAETDRQTDRQTDKQTETDRQQRQTDRQTDTRDQER